MVDLDVIDGMSKMEQDVHERGGRMRDFGRGGGGGTPGEEKDGGEDDKDDDGDTPIVLGILRTLPDVPSTHDVVVTTSYQTLRERSLFVRESSLRTTVDARMQKHFDDHLCRKRAEKATAHAFVGNEEEEGGDFWNEGSEEPEEKDAGGYHRAASEMAEDEDDSEVQIVSSRHLESADMDIIRQMDSILRDWFGLII